MDPTSDADRRNEADSEGNADPTEATPLWVKVFGAIALVVLVLLVLLLLTGRHGPSRHSMSASLAQQGPASGSQGAERWA
jgi:hypothetical protein